MKMISNSDEPLPLKKNEELHAFPVNNPRQDISRHPSSGKILYWVQQIEEKINANLEECSPADNANESHRPKCPIQTINEVETGELWLKAAQLFTEIILMIFAASLLVLVILTISTSKRPAIMDSYEIVPEILFILCLIVAAYSFFSWLYSKVHNLNRPKKIVTASVNQSVMQSLVENEILLSYHSAENKEKDQSGDEQAHKYETNKNTSNIPTITLVSVNEDVQMATRVVIPQPRFDRDYLDRSNGESSTTLLKSNAGNIINEETNSLSESENNK